MKRSVLSTMRDSSVDWLLFSGIIDRTVGSPTYGAFHYGFDPVTGSHLQTYSEITGYGVSLLVDLAKSLPDGPFMNLAINAANHLIGIQIGKDDPAGSGSFPHGWHPGKRSLSADCYTFDTAICLAGLADICAALSWDALREPIRAAADWLAGKAQRFDGSFRTRYSRARSEFEPLGPHADWFDDGCSLHAKCSIGLLKAAAVLNEERYRRAACDVLDWVLPLQNEWGAFVIRPESRQIYTHAHCYVTEGLLFAASCGVENADAYRAAADRGIRWLSARLNNDGSLNRFYPKRTALPEVVSDATAQASRLLFVHGDRLYRQTSIRCLDFLNGRQWGRWPWKGLWGSFCSKSYRFGPVLMPIPKTMCWPTLFAIHAATLALDGGKPYDLW